MPLSQTKEATREFVALLELHLSSIHPDYVRNRHAKGIRHEYIREIRGSLFAIHSAICIRGTYYHCFCLSLHRKHIGPYLYSPFTVGGRCDGNYTVTRACHSDLGLSPVDPVAPFRMSDSHRFRKGADQIIRRCLTEAETRFAPYYLSVWDETRRALKALLDFCAATTPDAIAASADEYQSPRHNLACHMLEFRRLHDALRPDQRHSFFAATVLTIPEIIRDLTDIRRGEDIL